MAQVDDPTTFQSLLGTGEEPILAPNQLSDLALDALPAGVQHWRIEVALKGNTTLGSFTSRTRSDAPIETDGRVTDRGERSELGRSVGALGKDGHGRDGDVESGELGLDELGKEGEVREDEGVESGRSEDVGVGIKDLEELWWRLGLSVALHDGCTKHT